MNQANLKLHIKELILHDLPRGQRQRIATKHSYVFSLQPGPVPLMSQAFWGPLQVCGALDTAARMIQQEPSLCGLTVFMHPTKQKSSLALHQAKKVRVKGKQNRSAAVLTWSHSDKVAVNKRTDGN